MRNRSLFPFLLLILLASFSFSLEDETPWWRLDVTMKVAGEYSLKAEEQRWIASYQGTLRARSVLEADGGDYILFQVFTEPDPEDKFVWVESPAAPSIHWIRHCEEQARPRLDLRFVLAGGGKVRLDLMMQADATPFPASGKILELILPRTCTGDGGARERYYSRGVRRGSNVLEWDQAGMVAAGKVEGSTQWEWREARGDWSHHHRVTVFFRVTPGDGGSH